MGIHSSLILLATALLISRQPVAGTGLAAATAAAPNDRFIPWTFPVAIDDRSSKEVKEEAATLARLLKLPAPLSVSRNPVCCIWIEVGTWLPQPSTPGYIMIIQPGGAIINASDVAQLRKAISDLERVIFVQGDRTHLPLGVFTNYPVMTNARDE